MKIKLENLRSLVKETLKETYFGGTTSGTLTSTAFNKVGPGDIDIENGVELPIDPDDLAEQIRALIGGDAGFPVGDWGDESLNAAAEAAANELINTNQKAKLEKATSLYEQRNLIKEAIDLVEEIESSEGIEHLTPAIERVIKILDSMDMSLDLIYAAVSGETGPISGTKFRQRFGGRTVGAGGGRGASGD